MSLLILSEVGRNGGHATEFWKLAAEFGGLILVVLKKFEMPRLDWDDEDKCLYCTYSSKRKHLKTHLTFLGKKGPRCPGLKVISNDVWLNAIVPYYSSNAELPKLIIIDQ
jgi:hypothetical protein